MIGYYVHHHGLGHLQRMRSVAQHLLTPLTVLTSLPASRSSAQQCVWLPMDNSAPTIDATAHGTLHWVPRHNGGLRTRMARIAGWVDATDPDLVVVDVSVEVALLCRLMGVPTVVVAMRGDRSDRAHRLAYDSAEALLAPWPAEFPEHDWPQSWRDKTCYSGAISRFADRTPPSERMHHNPPRVLVLWGTGGVGLPTAHIDAAIVACPGWEWRVPVSGEDVWELLLWADVVVTHGGQGAVAEVAAARRPAVVIAEQRPHDEQAATVRVLAGAGLAVGLQSWPDAPRWPALLQDALDLGGRTWSRWAPSDAALRAAGFLTAMAHDLRGRTTEPVAGINRPAAR